MRPKEHHLTIVLGLLVLVDLACSSQVTFFETPQPLGVSTLTALTLAE